MHHILILKLSIIHCCMMSRLPRLPSSHVQAHVNLQLRKRVRSQNSLGNRLVREFAIRRRFRAPPASRGPPIHRGRLLAELTLLATAFFPCTLRFEASPRPLLAMRHVGLLNSRAFGLTRRLTRAIAVGPLTLESPLENAPPQDREEDEPDEY